MPNRQQLDSICAGLLAGWSVRVYVRAMAATLFSMKDILPAAAAGALSAGMSFTICAGMSSTIVASHGTYSG